MNWIALKHVLLSHLPVATGLLLPWALIAAQRPGRGIRPWWTVTRYLGWTGFLGLLFAAVSGFASARLLGLIPPQRFLPVPATGLGVEALFFRHALLSAASLLVSVVAMWAFNRSRKDHQNLGFLALAVGLAWSALLLLAGESGYRLAHGGQIRPLPPPTTAPAPVATAVPLTVPPPVEQDLEATAPLRALDYGALEPAQLEPVKSPAHGGRWIRAWVTPAAAAAYRAGEALPSGAMVVLSSMEDRWGRPSSEPGPLYVMEMKDGHPLLSFYWARVPMAQRPAFGGESRVYWRGQDAHLEACRGCHATGMANPAQRSRWRVKRLTLSE